MDDLSEYRQLDQSASGSDQPYHTGLAQRVRTNTIEARRNRLRRAAVCYDVRDLPRIGGTFSYTHDNILVRLILPIMWRLSSRDIGNLSIKVHHDPAGGDVKVGCVNVPLGSALLPGFILDDPSNVDWGDENTTSGAKVTTELGPVGVHPNVGEDRWLMIFITFLSELAGSPARNDGASYPSPPSALDRWRETKIILDDDTPHTLTSENEPRAIGFQDTAKTTDWPDNLLAPPRQSLLIDDSSTEKGIYVYPPYLQAYNPGSANVAVFYDNFSYTDLYSVSIEETSMKGIPGTSAFNAGKAASTDFHRSDVLDLQEEVWGRHGRIYHIGGTTQLDDTDFRLGAANGAINKLHNYVDLGSAKSTAAVIGQCRVGGEGSYTLTDGTTTKTRTGYDVNALFCIAGHGAEGRDRLMPTYTVTVNLVLTDDDGSTATVTGGNYGFEDRQACVMPIGVDDIRREWINPIGYLLRAHHIDDPEGLDQENLLSHSMLGVFPEDVWSSGHWFLYSGTIVDTDTDSNRLLSIKVKGDTGDFGSEGAGTLVTGEEPKTFIHLVTWTVVAADTARTGAADVGA